ncbi:MAG: alkaline phosphatase PhoX [Terrimicrobiaceae bacterium]
MKKTILLTAAAVTALSLNASAQNTGPSTGSTPYAVPTHYLVNTYSVATVDNVSVADDTFTRSNTSPVYGSSAYSMVGIPDGMGAFQSATDITNGTFTLLVNHELGATVGVTRDHGSVGSFVSQWTINKNTLAVTGAQDLIQNVALWNGSGYTTFNNSNPIVTGSASAAVYNAAIGRLCSGDLAPTSAFSFGGNGTTERIFLSGEEIGAEGRLFAHIATGANAGTSYELPRAGKFSWENALANPTAQAKTIVIGLDDTTPGEVYMYVGTKTNTGTEVERAGLTNGLFYGVRVVDSAPQAETRSTDFGIGKGNTKAFSMVLGPNSGDVTSTSGAALQAAHSTDLVSNFLRPEDGAWDPTNGSHFYFVTTDRYDQVKDGVGSQVGRSRLWRMEFDDIATPELGGDIRLLLDGTEAGNMFDNISVDATGKVQIVEDVGNQQHNGKLWEYNPGDGSLTMLAQHDPARFGGVGSPSATPFNIQNASTTASDEEFSGIIDITALMAGSALSSGHTGERWFLMNDQTHYFGGSSGITSAQAEGGQLIAVQVVPEPSTAALLGLGALAFAAVRRRKQA